jgi:hypothetical protein
MQYKIDFSALNSEIPMPGVSNKSTKLLDKKIRLVEYTQDMPQHWCSKGHIGYMIEGEMEIEFETGKIIFNKGDGLFIPDGDEHKHKAKLLSKKAVLFFVENI